VPFRSVAITSDQGLSERDDFQLDVLRPPTLTSWRAPCGRPKPRGSPTMWSTSTAMAYTRRASTQAARSARTHMPITARQARLPGVVKARN